MFLLHAGVCVCFMRASVCERCRIRTHGSSEWKTLKKQWQIFSPQSAPPVRDIFRYTLHGKFHREIYRIRATVRAGFISCRTARKYQSLTLAGVLVPAILPGDKKRAKKEYYFSDIQFTIGILPVCRGRGVELR